MTRFQNLPNGISQKALAGLVDEAVQQALTQHGVLLDAEALVSASAIAGSLAAALPFLPQAQRLAIGSFKGDLTALATEFFRTMADKIARGGLAEAASLSQDPKPAPCIGQPAFQHIAEGAAELQSMVIEDWAGEVAGSTYLEEKLRIPRSTLHRWQRRNEVIALRKGGRRHVFPLAQFVDGRPALGIREVLSLIPNPRLAWFWLARPSPSLDGCRPIEMLKHDMVQEVVLAARHFSSVGGIRSSV
ncbi:hypothetical protein GCM10007880_61740 [Mesorhizobium amorphae]|uniref:antitoxin Xre/MbcA/ParS-like domain-containing protein n=1 Tax=Mesorhizobium amorphae TaxID=71433 RepID=UPI00235CDCEF|nr:antitoxin Xre/MbcA/ParS toxin-binding domain-containing protein [Mesorhizobium amorphae]GLR45656.1 hypothetical protein GCM10007880_61740 [Mesorhizobium amorphae]